MKNNPILEVMKSIEEKQSEPWVLKSRSLNSSLISKKSIRHARSRSQSVLPVHQPIIPALLYFLITAENSKNVNWDLQEKELEKLNLECNCNTILWWNDSEMFMIVRGNFVALNMYYNLLTSDERIDIVEVVNTEISQFEINWTRNIEIKRLDFPIGPISLFATQMVDKLHTPKRNWSYPLHVGMFIPKTYNFGMASTLRKSLSLKRLSYEENINQRSPEGEIFKRASRRASRLDLQLYNVAGLGAEVNSIQFSDLEQPDFDVLAYDLSELTMVPILIMNDLFLSPDAAKLINFCKTVKANYKDIPYHNYYHAVHTLWFCYWFVSNSEANMLVSAEEISGMLLAAYCHDINHPGNTNGFEIMTDSTLSQLYNHRSVLENMHAATTNKLLRDPETNIYPDMAPSEWKSIITVTITSILATDFSLHHTMVKRIQKIQNVVEFENDELIWSAIVHAADLSPQVLKRSVALQWGNRINDEFVNQAKLEEKSGLEVSFPDLENNEARWQSQIWYCENIVRPLFQSLGNLFPVLDENNKRLEENIDYYYGLCTSP